MEVEEGRRMTWKRKSKWRRGGGKVVKVEDEEEQKLRKRGRK